MKKQVFALFAVLSLLLTACGTDRNTIENSEKLQVVTSFYPMYLLAQAVTEGAEELELRNMAQPQTGCLHDYEMTISDRKLLEKADVLIINGGGMERILEEATAQRPDLKIVDTSEGIELLAEEAHHHEEETAEEHAAHEHDHPHEGNPHIWLSPARAAKQAENICEALSDWDTAETEIFEKNTAAFHLEMEELLAKAEALEMPEGEFAAIFHEGFGYLTELFRMGTAVTILADEYQEPSAKELAHAAEEAERHDIHFFLTAGDNGEKYAAVLAAENGEDSILLDPLTTADEVGLSYTERMRKNIEVIGVYGREAGK
ncbi:metal ABC transporter substrate-binding protein [Anaerotignum sp.]